MVACSQERGCANPVVQHGVFSTFSPPLALAFQPPEPEPRGRRGAGRHNLGNKIRRPLFNTQAEFHSGCSLQGDSSDTCAITIANANDRSAGTVTLRHSPPVPPPMLCDNTCLRHFGNCSKVHQQRPLPGWARRSQSKVALLENEGTDCDDCGARSLHQCQLRFALAFAALAVALAPTAVAVAAALAAASIGPAALEAAIC